MRPVLLPAILACAASGLFGQVFEVGMFGGASILRDSPIGSDILSPNAAAGSDIRLTNGFRLGFRTTLNTYRFLGFEFGYAYNRTQLHLDGPPPTETGMAVHQYFGDALIYGTSEGRRFRPFLAGGIHFSNFVPPGAHATSGGGETKFGANYGGGIKIKISSAWLIRFDVRQYETGKPFHLPNQNGRLFQNEISAGVSFAL